MNNLEKAMENLRESKKMESEKLAKLVEKKTLKESKEEKLNEDMVETTTRQDLIKIQEKGSGLYDYVANNYYKMTTEELKELALDAIYVADNDGEIIQEYLDRVTESKEVIEDSKLTEGKYGTLTDETNENEIFGSITNTTVYDRLREIRDYLHDYEQVVRRNKEDYLDNPDELAAAAFNIREALEALDKAWEEQ